MDVKKLVTSKKSGTTPTGGIDGRRRRALARLGLATAGAYVTPTLLSLQSTAIGETTAGGMGVAA